MEAGLGEAGLVEADQNEAESGDPVHVAQQS